MGPLFATLLVLSTPPDFQTRLEQAAKLAREGRWSQVVQLIRELEPLAAREAPLAVTDGRPLAEPAQGLGMYTPLQDGVVKGEELYLYAQVANHGLRKVKEGWELHLASDLAVLDAMGRELARDPGFGESRFTARVPHRDTFVIAALRVRGLPAGKYVARLTVRDRVDEKSGVVDIPFAVR